MSDLLLQVAQVAAESWIIFLRASFPLNEALFS